MQLFGELSTGVCDPVFGKHSLCYGRRGSTVACKPGYECVSEGWGMGRCHPQCRTNQDCSYGYTCNAMHPNLYLFYGPQNGVCHQPLQSPQPLLPPQPPPPPQQCRSPKDCRVGYYCNWTGTCFRLGVNGCLSRSDCKVGHACVHDRRLMDAPGRCHQQCTTDEDCPAGYTCKPQSIAYNALQLYPHHGLSDGVCHQSLTYLAIGK